MIVMLYPDDLVSDFAGNKRKPNLKDFPALDSDILSPFDTVVYNYNNTQIILKGPVNEDDANIKVSKRTCGNSSGKLTARHEVSKLLHKGSGCGGSSFLLGTLAGNPVD